jgi:hypothetical protein
MKLFFRYSGLAILILAVLGPACSRRSVPAKSEIAAWPTTIPCRIQDGGNLDLFLMTLGDVETPLSQGSYDPRTDEVKLNDGTIMQRYYQDTLGIKYYTPIDKSVFPLPPSGLCTWYYYYQDINEDEVKRNARWIAENLKDYGAQIVQIDDGWQKETKEGRHGSRDWTGVDKAFPGGMAALAAFIKSQGLTPGIWLAPHGQSNEDVVQNAPGVFLFKPDGTSASESWEGKFLVDPSSLETHSYLKDLFNTLCDWGYDYFKIDGQPVVVNEYRRTGQFMKNPGDPEELYRTTLATIRETIGPDRYLLGCWGTPLQGVGYMNGSRTGGDVVGGWSGFLGALRATMRGYYSHNIFWYADPDVLLVRPPLTLEQARVWATLQGLTGQALLSSDRLTDLSEDRVEILRRVFPAVDIRPLDLFPSQRNKRIWDLKISHLDRHYDVVGIFNFREDRPEQIELDWKELGLPGDRPIHVFDFWNGEYLGAWEAGMAIEINPTSCRVFTLLPMSDRIQLMSTNRHITQGWIDLVELESEPDGLSFNGVSRVIKNDPYQLRFVFPRGSNFAIKRTKARSSSGSLPCRQTDHQGWATVTIDSDTTSDVDWEVSFEPADSYVYPTQAPAGLRVERVGLDGIDFKWNAQYYLNAGYQVYLDGSLLGYTPDTSYPLRGLDPEKSHTLEVRSVWFDGSIGERHKTADLKFSLKSLLPEKLSLSALDPLPTAGWRGMARPIQIDGKLFEEGVAVPAGSEVEYDLKGLYRTFSASVGVDDGSPDDVRLDFFLVGDGRELWRSGPLKKGTGLKPVRISTAGIRSLILRVGLVDEIDPRRRRGIQGDWLDAQVTDRIKHP